MKIDCQCGCGKQLEKKDNRGRIRKFINGHNRATKGKDSRLTGICCTCKKKFKYYPTGEKGRFCSKKCQYGFDYKGSYWVGKNGYLYYQKGKKYKKLVHRIISGVLSGQVIHHKDGNKLNNNLINLEILKNQSEHIKKHNPIQYRWKHKELE